MAELACALEGGPGAAGRLGPRGDSRDYGVFGEVLFGPAGHGRLPVGEGAVYSERGAVRARGAAVALCYPDAGVVVWVPEEPSAMLRYAWVGGSIWGLEFGGLAAVVVASVLFAAARRARSEARGGDPPRPRGA